MSSTSPLRQAVNQILDRLPDDATVEDLQYHLHLRQKVEKGLQDIAAGRVIEDDEMGRRMQSWFDESDGRSKPPTT